MSPVRPTVAILGSGPSGLVAAAAAEMAGWWPAIITNTLRPSGMFGAQYLHEPIPFVTPDDRVQINYILKGTPEGYRDRVYGASYAGPVSPEEYGGSHDAWDIRETYGRLHNYFVDYMKVATVRPADVPDIKRAFVFVISTIPATALCPGYNVEATSDLHYAHNFPAAEIWAAGDAPEIGITLPYQCDDNTVICNGEEDGPAWYRMSRIYGRLTIEWPGTLFAQPPLPTVAKVRKPITTNCDCWVGAKFMRAGRYGEWKRGILVHEVYNTVYNQLVELKESL